MNGTEKPREKLFPLIEVCRRVPSRTGKPLSRGTVYRWAHEGLKSRSGRRVRLQATRAGGTICTSIEAVDRFFAELDEDLAADNTPAIRTPANRREADRKAAEKLKALGI